MLSQRAIELSVVERLLLSEPSVDDCAIRVRDVAGKASEIVAYVVTRGEFAPERWSEFLRDQLPGKLIPASYVALTALPIDEDGEIDEVTLASYAVIDDELVEQCVGQLEQMPEMDQVAVVIEENEQEPAVLHLSDLLNEDHISPPESPRKQPAKARDAEAVATTKRLAISTGSSLQAEMPATLSGILKRAASHSPSHGIIYLDSNEQESLQSYRELLDEAERILAGLRKLRVNPGDKIIFQLEREQDFVPAFWACTLGGFVPVPISIAPSYKEVNGITAKLYHTWNMLDHPLILSSEVMANAISEAAALFQAERFSVACIEDLRAEAPDKRWHQGQASDLALMLLTSGSTGMPKGVMLSNQNILSRSAGVAQFEEFSADDVLFNWFPLDHVGGIVMFHTLAVYLCAQQVLAPTNMILQTPLKWLDVVNRHRVSITWAPNFAFGLVNDNADEISAQGWDLSCLRFILNGGEAIVAKTSRRFLGLLEAAHLPATAIHPAWGMSETSSGITSSRKFALDTTSDDMSFVEVGGPIPGISLRIVDDGDNVIEEDKIGRLQVKGSTITSGYYKNDELNREAFSADGWFNTGDLGVLHDGCLTITGRTKDVIIINGVNFYSHEIEGVVEELDGVNVSFTAATAVRDPGVDTDKLAIFFSPTDPNQKNLSSEIRAHVLNRIGVNPDYIIPVDKQSIPKTAIGKIQRQQLRESFERDEFKEQLKQLDIDNANANTMPDWFFRRAWQRRESVVCDEQLLKSSYLILADQLGLADKLFVNLSEAGNICVLVERENEYQKIDSSHYRLDPRDAQHFQKLVHSLVEDEISVNTVLHLWHYTECEPDLDEAQRTGVYTLLHTIRALAGFHDNETRCRLLVVANQTQPVFSSDILAPGKATVLGLLKTIPLELSWLEPRHVDLEIDDTDTNALRVLRELTTQKSRAEIAYRGGKRYVAVLKSANLLEKNVQQDPIKKGGLYLITGGLGGVGTELARFLAGRYEAKLLLIGKTPLPPREQWSQVDKLESGVAMRVSKLSSIERAGGQVRYEAVDVCDFAGLKQAVAQAETFWNLKLSGIFHLAGGLGEATTLEQHWTTMDFHRILLEDPQNFHRAFAPKVFGTVNLAQLLVDRPDVLFVLFSSVNSIFGGATFSAYSAANSFLDCYAHHLHNTSHLHTYCLNWSMWDDLGMSRGNPEFARDATRNMGFYIMSKEQALNSLLAGLLRREPQLVVGVDHNNHNSALLGETVSRPLNTLRAYTHQNGDRLAQLIVKDRFGNNCACELSRAGSNEVQGRRRQIEPRTVLERAIANIWREVLHVPQISVDDNFFELGGQSLLATQVVSRLRKSVYADVSLSAFFIAPTISELADWIEKQDQPVTHLHSTISPVPRDRYRVKPQSL